MFHNFRNSRMATTAIAGAVFIPVLIGAGTAAADDISVVNVTNSGKLPVKVVILNITFGELGRTSSPEFVSGSGGGGKATLKTKVNQYHWEAFAKGPDGRQDIEPCDSDHRRGVSASSITAHCDHTMAAQTPAPAPQKTPAPAPAPPPTAAVAPPANKTTPPNLQLNQAQLYKEVQDADADFDQVRRELDSLNSNSNDPNASQKLEALYKRYDKDYQTIIHIKTILQGWAATSPIVTNPPDWTKIEKKTKDLADTFTKLAAKICAPSGSVSSGDAGSNAPPAPSMESGTPGLHVAGCKRNTNIGSH
jgi:hypothetical protein